MTTATHLHYSTNPLNSIQFNSCSVIPVVRKSFRKQSIAQRMVAPMRRVSASLKTPNSSTEPENFTGMVIDPNDPTGE